MSRIKSSQKRGRRRVIFSLESPDAKEVILMGDFNQWNPKKHPMKKYKNGVWEKTTMLFPGTYEYRFMVDGQWKNDPDNDQTCVNRFGTNNNFIVVSST
ncbi:MAG: isoamylase early set domain-containing protein [Deltaproteobacteria bacterium]|nr:isoamylase early set domain-containing protein [Deltaproteobacteria bacterium]